MARLAEKLRRAVDLEHWSAFNTSFERICDWLRRIAEGDAATKPPATIVLLGGDVHNASVSRIDLGTTTTDAGRVFQIVCSPFRNPLSSTQRRVVRLTGSKGATLLFAFLGRLAHVPPPSAEWNFVRRPSFDNAIGELAFERRAANVTLRRSAREREDAERLQLLHATELSTD